MAAQFANGNVHQLERIERIKGTLFIMVSGAAFFAVSLFNLRRMQAAARTIQQQQETLLVSEQRAIAGMCSASLAHDLNNVLTALGGMVDLCADGQINPASMPTLRQELAASIEDLGDMSRRMSNVVKTSMPSERAPADIGAATRQTVDLARLHPDARNRSLSVDIHPAIHAVINRSLFDQMLFNLLLNGAQAAPPHGTVQVTLRVVNEDVVLQVHDNGPGLPDELAERIFEPCFTTRPDGNGLGLLSVTAFTDLHGGKVTTGRSPLGGALFEVRFPCCASPAGPMPAVSQNRMPTATSDRT